MKTGAAISVVVLVLAISWAITAAIIMLLWNVIVPGVFDGPVITFWQALAGGFLIGVVGKLLGFGRSNSN